MRRTFAAIAALALLAATPASASPSEVNRVLPNAERVGEASYSVLSVRLFNAELFANGGAFSWDQPFALSITYDRQAQASTLINRSIREMSSRGAGNARTLAPLRTQLERCFTTVAQGDRFTGVSTSAETAVFYLNGAQRCEVRWPNFRRHFFGIWLAGRDGAAARLSAQLRGES
ncbi:MAG: chalcone isomerase family protein [Hyphomonadaceae bacterium]|nr:chalcone isomerase family protein [Hyphomonadaceae bacterium]